MKDTFDQILINLRQDSDTIKIKAELNSKNSILNYIYNII